jgi:hypothetical protein
VNAGDDHRNQNGFSTQSANWSDRRLAESHFEFAVKKEWSKNVLISLMAAHRAAIMEPSRGTAFGSFVHRGRTLSD